MSGEAAADRPGRERFVAAVAQLVVAVVVTAPLAWNLGRLPLGAEPVATVPQFNLWTLRWTASRLPHGLSGWWDAPIFWPQRGAFAFSEPQPLTGIAYALARPVFGTVGAYSFLLIATLALNGICAAALARRLGAAPVPAVLVGALAQALPFVFDQIGVLQLAALWPLFAATACLVAWLDEPRVRHAVLLGASLAAAVATCGYYALLFGLCLLVAAPFVARASWRHDWEVRVAGVALGAGVLLVLAAPVALGQQARLGGHRWRAETILAGSASWSDWAPDGPYWPGYPLIVLAAGGLVVGRRSRATRLALALLVTSLLASLGSNLSVFGHRPWPFLVDHVDAVARLRSPFRAVAITQVALVILAVPALGWLWSRRSAAVRASAPVLVVAALLAAGAGPGRLVDPPRAPGTWAAWLADHPDGGLVAFIPFAPGPSAGDFEPTTERMLQALDTDHPMVNGYSGFFPHDHGALRDALDGFPDVSSLDALQARGVRYVVVDTAAFGPTARRAAARLGLRVIDRDGDATLLRVPR